MILTLNERENNMAIDPALLDQLQALSTQFKVELAGTVTAAPSTPPPSDPFDVKPVV